MKKEIKIEGYETFKEKEGRAYTTYSDGNFKMPEGNEIPYSLNSQFDLIQEFFEKELKKGNVCRFSFTCYSFEEWQKS